MPIERKLLSDDQMKGMTELWSARPPYPIGPCRTCDHHGTLEPDGRCLWCHGRDRKVAAAPKPEEG